MSTGIGTLYVVATPIGNLDDISTRAISVLGSVDLVAGEDTRRVRQLLTHFGISCRLMSLHEHNESRRVQTVIDRLQAGDNVALVSDAGTPLVSDPGYRLVAAARELGLPVSPIPGSCALIAALSVAGLPTDRFRFEGFLPARSAARRTVLGGLSDWPETLVFYESVHRIHETLKDMSSTFGSDRPVTVARELTKLYETFYHGSIETVREQLAADSGANKGEYTLVVGGNQKETSIDQQDLERIVSILCSQLPAAQAATLAGKITGATRKQAYKIAVGLRGNS